MDRFLKDYIQFMECFDKKIAILSPPQRTASRENTIGQMEAVAQFSYSHRYKKRGKFVWGFLGKFQPPKFSLYFGLSKTVIFFLFVEFSFDKNWKGNLGGAPWFFIQPKVQTNNIQTILGCRSTLKNRFWKHPAVQLSCNSPIYILSPKYIF